MKVLESDLRMRAVYGQIQLEGTPYLWGGNHPGQGGIDCSGDVLHVYRTECGIDFYDQRARDLEAELKPVSVLDVLPGDLAFYGRAYASHVTMVLTPGATLVSGANGGHSFRWAGIPKDFLVQLTAEELETYQEAMDQIDACVRVEQGYRYRGGFRGFRAMPIEQAKGE